MISVIVPVYKVEKYLRKCVESIQNQTYRDLEIILVDDGSPDNCGKICDELANDDKRIKVIHQKNGGLSCARNAGLDVATGEYVTFIDSDDYIAPEMYEKMCLAIERDSCDVCMCGSQTVNDQGEVLATDSFWNRTYIGTEIISSFVLPLRTAAWNKLIKRETIEDNRFPEGRIHGEDLVFFSNYFTNKSKLVTIDYLGYFYVKHSSSITTSSFSDRSFDEVYCKDLSSLNISRKFPQYKNVTICWSFRARINLIRKMISCNEIQYLSIISEYLEWMKEKYHLVIDLLDIKTKIEYKLLVHSKKIYKIALKISGK